MCSALAYAITGLLDRTPANPRSRGSHTKQGCLQWWVVTHSSQMCSHVRSTASVYRGVRAMGVGMVRAIVRGCMHRVKSVFSATNTFHATYLLGLQIVGCVREEICSHDGQHFHPSKKTSHLLPAPFSQSKGSSTSPTRASTRLTAVHHLLSEFCKFWTIFEIYATILYNSTRILQDFEMSFHPA